MGRRYDESLAEIDYEGRVELNLGAIATPLIQRMGEQGCRFDLVGTVEDSELQFLSRALIVTVMCDPENPSRIRISAETPRDTDNSRAAARLRFAATVAAVRHFILSLPAQQVVWTHAGKTYVTDPNRHFYDHPLHGDTPLYVPGESFTTPGQPHNRADPDHGSFRPEESTGGASLRTRDGEAFPPGARDRGLTEKLTVYTLNATVMVLSLPVGAALMTYNLLRGGSVSGASRALALTGTAFGLTALPATQGLAGSVSAAGALPWAMNLLSIF